MESSNEKVVKTACNFCLRSCGINAFVRDGKIVKIEGMPEHPVNRGRLCPKGTAIIDYVYSPNRLKYPMKKVNGEFVRISWDEAMDTIVAKLKETKEKYGPKGLAICQGLIMLAQGIPTYNFIRRVTDVYGTPNFFSVDSMCYRPRFMGYILTLGTRPIADTENAKCIIIWGCNPDASGPVKAWSIADTVKNGAKLIVIDPRRTVMAKRAEIHVQPRPGTDCALALAFLNVIIGEKLYDREFVEKWTVGFDRLAEHVKKYPPEEVEKITWVPAGEIRKIARTFASIKPACIIQGMNGLDQTTSGVQSSRAVAILHAITGNHDVPGGFISTPLVKINKLRLLDMMECIPLGIDKYPLFYEVHGVLLAEGQGMTLADTLLTDKPYPIKTLFICGSNPLLTWPNSNKLKEAFRKVDFLLYMTLTMNETAQIADMVLPMASFMERLALCNEFYTAAFGLPYLILRKKVVQVGECWSDMKFWLELSKRMGYEKYIPWKSEEEILDHLLEPSGLTVKQLTEEKPEGVVYDTMKYKQYEQKGFNTPSGKVEIYSETMAKLGYDPLPTYREPEEGPVSRPDIANDYPLILTTGSRNVRYVASQLRDIPKLRKGYPNPTAEMNTRTAAQYGIKNGDKIFVETKRGSIEVYASVSEDIIEKVVNVLHGWSEANVNLLTDMKPCDPVSGVPLYKSMLCRIKKVSALELKIGAV